VDIRRGLAQANPQAFLPDLAMSLTSLGNRLSELGRREEALAAAQEAVDIRRRLAQANPQAFLPDLAKSLNNLGDRLSEVKRSQEALEAYEEAVRALAPFFLQLPAAFADRMSYMVRHYFDACQAAGREPDGELLGPVVEALAGLAQAGRLQV
jgi:tetratricopeptide (TPR) repeat protein